MRQSGLLMLAASACIGLVFSLWLTWSIYGLICYAREVSAGRKVEAPTGGGRQFSELARALALMRSAWKASSTWRNTCSEPGPRNEEPSPPWFPCRRTAGGAAAGSRTAPFHPGDQVLVLLWE